MRGIFAAWRQDCWISDEAAEADRPAHFAPPRLQGSDLGQRRSAGALSLSPATSLQPSASPMLHCDRTRAPEPGNPRFFGLKTAC